MSGKTNIEWATRSWNPTVGCTRVSAGCDNCYAYYLHDRMRYAPNVRAARKAGFRSATVARSQGVRLPLSRQYDVPFSKVQLLHERLSEPATWLDPELIFVDSMADLMHEDVPDEFIDRVFDVADDTARHCYLILSKRPARYAERVISHWGPIGAPEHVWLGTSVEDERVLDRVDELRQTPARVRFLSCEPLLGPLNRLDLRGINWVIAGGESGRTRRPIDPAWVRELRDLCISQGVAFFFKQWGGITPKASGRVVDGRLWSQYPTVSLRPSPEERSSRAHKHAEIDALVVEPLRPRRRAALRRAATSTSS